MVKRIQKYVKYTLKELEEYAKTKDSCIIKINNSMHIGLPPHGLSNTKESILEIIADQIIGFYDTKLQGVILDVRNIKVIGDSGNIRADDPIIHLNIRGDCYVFQAQIGAIIRGIVKYISSSGSNYIGVIIYRVFCVPIKLQDHTKKSSIKINSEIEFRIKNFDLQSSMPFIEGELVAKEEDSNQQFSNSFEDNEVSDDESIQNERQIKFSNNQRYNSESDAESEDLFDIQDNVVMTQRLDEVKREVNLQGNYDSLKEEEEIKSESNNSIEVFTDTEEVEVKQETVEEENEIFSTQKDTKESMSPFLVPSNKKQKQTTLTENILNKVKTEIKRERTISKTISSLGGSLDNLFENVEREEKEFLKSKENGIDEKNTDDNENIETKFKKSPDLEKNETKSPKKIEISDSDSKKTKKKKLNTKLNADVLSKDVLDQEQNAHEMFSDRESVINSSQQSKKSKKKKKKNNLDNFMSDILVEIKNEKLNSEQQSVNNKEDISLNNNTNHVTDHSDGKKSKTKKKRKNNLENSMFDIINELKTENLDTVEEEEQQQQQSSQQLQQISDTKKKKNKKSKRNLNDSILDVITEIKVEKLEEEPIESSLENGKNDDEVKKGKIHNIDDNKNMKEIHKSSKKKRKISVSDAVNEIINKLSSPSQEHETKSMMNSFSSPLLSSTMINAKKRKKV